MAQQSPLKSLPRKLQPFFFSPRAITRKKKGTRKKRAWRYFYFLVNKFFFSSSLVVRCLVARLDRIRRIAASVAGITQREKIGVAPEAIQNRGILTLGTKEIITGKWVEDYFFLFWFLRWWWEMFGCLLSLMMDKRVKQTLTWNEANLLSSDRKKGFGWEQE